MEHSEQLMEPPEEFPFAFQPYGIQRDFMRNLYTALERGKVGIFESPTGTGKTMSMICGALKWLCDNEQREKERLEKILSGTLPVTQAEPSDKNANKSTATEPDWFTAFDEQKAQKEAAYRLKQEAEAKMKRQERLKQLKERLGYDGWKAKKRKDTSQQPVEPVEENADDDVVVADYVSEDEKAEDSDTEEEVEEENVTKIYFCSRTHSQLAQFVREVKKSPFGDTVSVITLGSRQNLCINDQVTQLKSQSLINERCLELQRDKKKAFSLVKDDGSVVKRRSTKGDGRCPFYKPGPLENFSALALIDELGRTIANLCMVVPGGLVCFFPSYEYEKKVHAHWSDTGTLEKIGKKKQVFREPTAASQVDQVLSSFAKCIQFNAGNSEQGLNGALLLSVVGGKLSEGINFSDDLGRCIVMVGLPYPNITSPELKEKVDYLNSTMPKCPDGRTAGQVYYDNQCLKAVNQSIGRSIRHSKDYATIVLLDVRYGKPSIHKKLPTWIGNGLMVHSTFGPAFAAIRKFFTDKKKK